MFWIVATSCVLGLFLVAIRGEQKESADLHLALSLLLMVRQREQRHDHAKHARSLAIRPRHGPLVELGAHALPPAPSTSARLDRAGNRDAGFPCLAGETVSWPAGTD